MYGCHQAVGWWLEPWTCSIAGVSVGFVITHAVFWFLEYKLRSALVNEEQQQN